MTGSGRVWLAGIAGFALGVLAHWAFSGSRSLPGEPGRADPIAEGARAGEPAPVLSSPAGPAARREASEPVAEVRGPSEASRTSTPTSSTLVYGRLLEMDGSPLHRVAWGWVDFVDHAGKRRVADARQGAYAIADLPVGKYAVSARAEACRPVEDSFELTADRTQAQKDFRLPRCAVIRVRVDTPEGKPLFAELDAEASGDRYQREIVPVATKEDPGRHVYEVVGSLNNPFGVGQFWQAAPGGETLPTDCIGVVLVGTDLPVYVSLVHCHAVLQTRRAERGAEEVVFVLTPQEMKASEGSLRVQVVEAASSAPIEGAFVVLEGGPFEGGSVTSTADGFARIEHALPGRFQLQVRKEGYEHVVRTADVEPGEETDVGVITLARGVTAELRVVDGQGNPVSASFTLGPLSRAGGRTQIDTFGGAWSKADGSLLISNLGRKVYVLRTINQDAGYDGERPVSPWVSGNFLLDMSSGSVRDTEIRLKQGVNLAIRVEGGSADGLRFDVLDSSGVPLVESRFYGSAPRPLRLPAGTYRVELRNADGNVLGGRDVALAADPVELALPR